MTGFATIQPLARWLRITQGWNPPKHNGIDYAVIQGTPVRAVCAGYVVWAAWNTSGYGNLVKVDHGGGFVSYYAHLSAFMVRVGQNVQAGDIVALSGSTGNSTGPHLHYELRKNNKAVNPNGFFVADDDPEYTNPGDEPAPRPPYYPEPEPAPPDEPDPEPAPKPKPKGRPNADKPSAKERIRRVLKNILRRRSRR